MFHLGLIGTSSNRGAGYIGVCKNKVPEGYRISALCDINEEVLNAAAERYYPDGDVKKYTDYRKLLDDPEIDGVIICTPDKTHRQITEDCVRAGKHVLLEKPISNNKEDAFAIYDICKDYHKTVKIGFVLRWSEYYKKIKELITDGTIGEVISIQANEFLNYDHGSSFFRRWHRKKENSGGLLNCKCSHDFDILNWLVDKRPLYVQSFGGLSGFKPIENDAENCDQCKLKDTCMYDFNRIRSSFPNENICVYNCEKDIVDHQTVNILYEDNVTANLHLSAISAYETRTMTVYGTKATITGNFTDMKLKVKGVYPQTEAEFVFEKHTDHGGGDTGLMNEFVKSIRGEIPVINDIEYALLASVLAFGADKSKDEHLTVNLSEFTDGRIS